jgi:hypothetical protein
MIPELKDYIEWCSAAASDLLYLVSSSGKSARRFIGMDIDEPIPTLQNRLQQHLVEASSRL